MRRFLTISNAKKTAAAFSLVGVGTLVSREIFRPKLDLEISRRIPKLGEDVFEKEDNLAVFLIPSAAVHEHSHQLISEILTEIQAREKISRLKKVKFLFSYPEEAPADAKKIILVLYKGQRKHREFLDERFSGRISDWDKFFETVSDPRTPEELTGTAAVREIAGNSFQAEVTEDAKKTPVLLELYEKNCFLCFLMRPFLNSVSRDLKAEDIPVTFKRMEIESNDFPENCPVVRGTPTFVFYPGKTAFERWSEFRPQEFLKKLFETVEVPSKLRDKIEKFPGLLSERFQLFSTVVMWQTELEKAQISLATKSFVSDDKEMFNANVTAAMAEDAARSDDLETNLRYFRKEAENAEMDAILIGQQLAQKIIDEDV